MAQSTRSDQELRAILANRQSDLSVLTPLELKRLTQLLSDDRSAPNREIVSLATSAEEARTAPGRHLVEQGLRGAFAGATSSLFQAGDILRHAMGLERPLQQPGVRQEGEVGPTRTPLQAAMTAPPTPAGRIGFGTEQLAEFLIPLRVASTMATYAPKGLKMGAKMLGEGGEFAAKQRVQAGDAADAEEILFAGFLGSLAPPIARVARQVGKTVTRAVPERLYAQVFPVAEKDVLAEWRAVASQQPVNPVLAREVIDRGLKGSARNMGIYTLMKLQQLEGQVQALVTGGGAGAPRPLIALPKKEGIIEVLDGISARYHSGFFRERGADAARLSKGLRQVSGQNVRVSDALAARRLLDDIRATSSFRLDPSLSAQQEELKGAADYIRSQLRTKSPRFAELMHEERIMIEARDAILDRAVKDKNRRLLGMMDMILGGGGIGMTAAVGPYALAPWAIARGFQQPRTLTTLAQGLYQAGRRTPQGTPEALARLLAAVGLQMAPENETP